MPILMDRRSQPAGAATLARACRLCLCVVLICCLGCHDDMVDALADMTCDRGLDSLHLAHYPGIGYDKVESIVRGPADKLSLFTRDRERKYRLLHQQEDLLVGSGVETGDYFAIYQDASIYEFKSPTVKEIMRDSVVREYVVSDSFAFLRSSSARPIVTEDFILSPIHPPTGIVDSFEEFMRIHNTGPLFVLIDRDEGTYRRLGNFPIDHYPYDQVEERRNNGLEYTYHYCLIGTDIYFMIRTSAVLYRIDITTGRQEQVDEFDHHVFSALGANQADEQLEKEDKATFFASIPTVRDVKPIKGGSQLLILVSQPHSHSGGFIDQLQNNMYLVVYDIAENMIRRVIFVDDHYPFLAYADDAVLLFRQRRKRDDEESNHGGWYTRIYHDCL